MQATKWHVISTIFTNALEFRSNNFEPLKNPIGVLAHGQYKEQEQTTSCVKLLKDILIKTRKRDVFSLNFGKI